MWSQKCADCRPGQFRLQAVTHRARLWRLAGHSGHAGTCLHHRIRPHVWKRSLGLTSDKEQARLRAMQLFPGTDLRRKRAHGRAEALLLAWHG
jgi:hypothetical protein